MTAVKRPTVADPRQVAALYTALRSRFSDLTLGAHFHDYVAGLDRGVGGGWSYRRAKRLRNLVERRYRPL